MFFRYTFLIALIGIALPTCSWAQEVKPQIRKAETFRYQVQPQQADDPQTPVFNLPELNPNPGAPGPVRPSVHKHHDAEVEFLLDSIKQAMRRRVLADTATVFLETEPTSKTPLLTAQVDREFEGNLFNGYRPPDNAIAISDAGYIVSIVNSSISFSQENGNVLLNSQSLNDFFDYLNLANFVYDPRVLYDPTADRFIIVALAGNTPASSRVIVSFSQGQNPADGWWSYVFEGDVVSGNVWFDYPQIGASAEDLYITGNLYTANNQYSQSVVLQMDKEVGYQGQTLNYTYWSNVTGADGFAAGSLKPVQHGFDQGYGSGIYLISVRPFAGNQLNLFEVTGDYGTNPVLNVYGINCDSYEIGSNTDQAGAASLLDVGDCRIQMAYYDNGVIHYVHHNEFTNGYNGIRYGRIDVAGQSITSANFGLNGYGYTYPVIAPLSNTSGSNDVLMGFTRSSANSFPELRAVTIEGNFEFSSSISLKEGETGMVPAPQDNVQRWGDYSGIARRHNAATPTVWVFGCYGKGNTYGNWIAELTASGGGGGGGDDCNDNLLTLELTLDEYGSETTWQVRSDNGTVVDAGGPYQDGADGTVVTEEICVTDGCYTFEIFDAFGDGICCEYGNGSYVLRDAGNNTLAQGGAFASNEATDFCQPAGGGGGGSTCEGTTTLAECTGAFGDGSANDNYSNNLNCGWLISPAGATSITLSFNSFDTETCCDFVRVFDGTDAFSPLIGEFSGSTLPQAVTGTSGRLFVEFTTNESNTGAGWSASYTCNTNTTTLEVSPANLSFAASGGNQNATVTAGGNWQASASQDWISLNGSETANGAGDGAFQVAAAANTLTNARSATITVVSGGQTATINVTQAGAEGGEAPWTTSVTGDNHTVILPATLDASIDGAPLQPGDYVGFFYEHDGQLHCSNYVQWTGANISVAAYGNDADAPDKNGFGMGETFKVRIYQAATDNEYAAQVAYEPVGAGGGLVTHTDSYANDGISMVASLTASSSVTLEIPIQNGWNMISSYVIPAENNMLTLLADIADDIALVKDGAGSTTIPSLDINAIGDWRLAEGYKVRANANTSLIIEGAQADPLSTAVPIQEGWQIISYLRDQPGAVEEQLQAIEGVVEIVKNNTGQNYIPEWGINTLGNLEPTQGYKLKADAAATLFYPQNFLPGDEEQKNDNDPIIWSPTQYFVLDSNFNTGNNGVIVVPAAVLGEILVPGDELGVFTEDGILCGVAVVEAENFAITVWGDDPSTTDVKEGMLPEESYQLRAWKTTEELEIGLQMTPAQGDGRYQEDDFEIVASLDIMSSLHEAGPATYALRVFPNPVDEELQVEVPEAVAGLLLYDARGQLLRSWRNLAPGRMTIGMKALPRGIYLLRAQAGGQQWMARVVKR